MPMYFLRRAFVFNKFQGDCSFRSFYLPFVFLGYLIMHAVL